MRGWWAIVLAGVLATGCAALKPRGSTDRPQIAVLDLKGARGADDPAQRYVEERVTRTFDVVSADTYWDMAKQLGAMKLTRRDVRRVSEALGLSAVVHGNVRPRSKKSGKPRRRQTIRLIVRDGATGKILEKHRVKLRRGSVTADSDKRMAKRFLAKVEVPVEQPDTADEQAVAADDGAGTDDEQSKAGAEAKTADKGKGDKGKGDKGKDAEPAEDEEPALPPVEYDDRGQAIDDESPL